MNEAEKDKETSCPPVEDVLAAWKEYTVDSFRHLLLTATALGTQFLVLYRWNELSTHQVQVTWALLITVYLVARFVYFRSAKKALDRFMTLNAAFMKHHPEFKIEDKLFNDEERK
jgi:hypothetical protein